MKYLLIDVSNSRSKLALSDGKEIYSKTTLPTAELGSKLAKCIKAWTFNGVVLSSVVPKATAHLERFFSESPNQKPLLKVNCEICLGLEIDYPEPQSIGADRLANAVALSNWAGTPAIAIDFGTAVTFDVLDERPAYLGGVIAPGLALMGDYLVERTALLPKIEAIRSVPVIGKSTELAMQAGAYHGYRGMIREILDELMKALAPAGERVRIMATGGYAELFADRLDLIETVDPDLTMQGLRIIGELNTESFFPGT